MYSKTPIEAVFKRDRIIVISGIAVVSMLAWMYMIYLAYDMDMMGSEMTMMPMMRLWSVGDFVLMYV
jgi:predicted metal-binding membrane protein